MNNVDKLETDNEIEEKLIKVKSYQGFNESNLMTLPFISLKRKKEKTLVRKWRKENQEVGLKVVGGENGCPTMYDLDVLLALFRLMLKEMNNEYKIKNNKIDFPKRIHFTFRKLAKEMGFKNFGSGIKKRLETSIKTLNETTIYSSFAFKDQEEGIYVKTFKGEQSCRIICNFRSYSVEERKFNGQSLAGARDIEEQQSIDIDDFFYKNMCSNYFKLYDYDKYIKLTQNIAKKLLLILSQWSSGYEKFLTMQVVYDYIGIEINDKKQEYYYNTQLKKALDDLVKVGFIKDYEFKPTEGILFVFNVTVKNKAKGFDKYRTDAEIIARLREIGVSYDDIYKYCKLDTLDYISGLLRYIDDRETKGKIDDILSYTQKGLPYGTYNVDEFIIEL